MGAYGAAFDSGFDVGGGSHMGVCADWITDTDVEACDATVTDGIDPAILASILTQASELAYVLSGRQFPGECTFTVRPCGAPSSGTPSPLVWGEYPSLPYRSGGPVV